MTDQEFLDIYYDTCVKFIRVHETIAVQGVISTMVKVINELKRELIVHPELSSIVFTRVQRDDNFLGYYIKNTQNLDLYEITLSSTKKWRKLKKDVGNTPTLARTVKNNIQNFYPLEFFIYCHTANPQIYFTRGVSGSKTTDKTYSVSYNKFLEFFPPEVKTDFSYWNIISDLQIREIDFNPVLTRSRFGEPCISELWSPLNHLRFYIKTYLKTDFKVMQTDIEAKKNKLSDYVKSVVYSAISKAPDRIQ